MSPYHRLARPVILAPNWLGDAVMALPAIADIRRGAPQATITVAARPSIAPLFTFVDSVDSVLEIESGGWTGGAAALASKAFDCAVILRNSLPSAIAAYRAGIPERWGYRMRGRGPLLTRAVAAPSGVHQVEFYQRLVSALGFPNGSRRPGIAPSSRMREAGHRALCQAGWNDLDPIVAVAPGAGYGGAKRWPPDRFAELIGALGAEGVSSVLIGTADDRRTADEVMAAIGQGTRILDLTGRTDLHTLAGVLTGCRGLVTNDSGAMHLAAALGVPVTAMFGPTDVRATRPIGEEHVVITGSAWCQPCMLRECPLDHECMVSIRSSTVVDAARRAL